MGATPPPPLDIVAIGRSCIDLYGEQVGGRLEDMLSFAKYVGGSPTNTAIGCARLGLQAGLATRVDELPHGMVARRDGEDVDEIAPVEIGVDRARSFDRDPGRP